MDVRSLFRYVESSRNVMPKRPPGHPADRKPRRFWFDPRFVIGLVLVAGSVVGSVALIAANDSSIRVFAARETVVPGQKLLVGDLVAVSVRLDAAESHYLRPEDFPEEGVVVTRSIEAGEIVPRAAVGRASGADTAAVVLSLTSGLPESVRPGGVLDIWSAKKSGSGEYEAPVVIVSSAIVVRLISDDQLLSNGSGTSVEVLVPREAVAAVLESVANGAALSAVPDDIPLAG
jgi:hypothetical protein